MNQITKIFIKRQLKTLSQILLGLLIAAAIIIAILIFIDLQILGEIALFLFIIIVLTKIYSLLKVYFQDEIKISRDLASKKGGE